MSTSSPPGSGVDCNDGDVNVHPSAAERCDHVDQDCDTRIDEGVTITVYADRDADSHGDSAAPRSGCAGDPGTALLADDCFDRDANVFPGQTTYFAEYYCRSGSGRCDLGMGPGCLVMVGMFMTCDTSMPSWDYDCSGAPTREPLGSMSCSGDCIMGCRGGGIVYGSTAACGSTAPRYGCGCMIPGGCVASGPSSSQVRCR
jgi:hypothetical protein